MRQISAHEIINHGIHHEQYFLGCSCTAFDECYTGIGNDAHEALDDALEQAACSGWEVEGIANEERKRPKVLKRHGDEAHYYVSIRLKGQPDVPEEGDYITGDHLTVYQYGKKVFTLIDNNNFNEAVRRHMQANNFVPDVWFIDDHGGHTLINLEDK